MVIRFFALILSLLHINEHIYNVDAITSEMEIEKNETKNARQQKTDQNEAKNSSFIAVIHFMTMF